MSPKWLNPKETREVLDFFHERFGVAEDAFNGMRLLEKGDYILAVAEDAADISDNFDIEDAGLPLLKLSHSKAYKPVTVGVQAFCANASKNLAQITLDQLGALAQGQSLSYPDGKGFVLLKVDGEVIGVGLVRDGKLLSQLPQSMTSSLEVKPRRK